MNLKSISFYLGFFCFPISFLAFINILYASYFDYFLSINSYFITFFISNLALGLYFIFWKKINKKINFIEQLILIILVYLILGFLISIPYYLSNFTITFIMLFLNQFQV